MKKLNWLEKGPNGPYNAHDYPLFIKTKDGQEAFFKQKEDYLKHASYNHLTHWSHWLPAYEKAVNFRIREQSMFKGDKRFWPEFSVVVDGVETFHTFPYLNDSSDTSSLGGAKEVVRRNTTPIPEDVFHPYP